MELYDVYTTGGYTQGDLKATLLWSSLSNYTSLQNQTIGLHKCKYYDCGTGYGNWYPTKYATWYEPTQTTVAVGNSITNFQYWINPETAEQRVAREASEAESARKRIEINNRAEELLLLIIDGPKKQQYIEQKFFDVQVNGRTYRVHRGRSKNIDLLENGEVKEKFCIHPAEQVPDPDTMLAQYLLLTTDEQKFLRMANRWAA